MKFHSYNLSWLDRRKAWCPCPGWLGDPLFTERKIERWIDRPQAAWRLYWRTHPKEYSEMFERWRNR